MSVLFSKSLGLNTIRSQLICCLYLHKGLMLGPIQCFLEEWQELKKEKKKMKGCHSTLSGNHFCD